MMSLWYYECLSCVYSSADEALKPWTGIFNKLSENACLTACEFHQNILYSCVPGDLNSVSYNNAVEDLHLLNSLLLQPDAWSYLCQKYISFACNTSVLIFLNVLINRLFSFWMGSALICELILSMNKVKTLPAAECVRLKCFGLCVYTSYIESILHVFLISSYFECLNRLFMCKWGV